jgi:hypothetical protein
MRDKVPHTSPACLTTQRKAQILRVKDEIKFLYQAMSNTLHQYICSCDWLKFSFCCFESYTHRSWCQRLEPPHWRVPPVSWGKQRRPQLRPPPPACLPLGRPLRTTMHPLHWPLLSPRMRWCARCHWRCHCHRHANGPLHLCYRIHYFLKQERQSGYLYSTSDFTWTTSMDLPSDSRPHENIRQPMKTSVSGSSIYDGLVSSFMPWSSDVR